MNRRLFGLLLCAWLAVAACAGPRTTGPLDRERQDRELYDLYRQYMETLNRNRERAGVPPLPVRSFEDWRRAPGTP